jgi:hypothetical protein
MTFSWLVRVRFKLVLDIIDVLMSKECDGPSKAAPLPDTTALRTNQLVGGRRLAGNSAMENLCRMRSGRALLSIRTLACSCPR